MRRDLRKLFVLLAAAAGCQEMGPASRESAIIDGDPAELDVDATALLFNVNGFSACSGSIIAPRVVITAKHCLGEDPTDPDAPFSLTVLGRPTMNRDDQYDVVAGRTTDGAGIDNVDFAVLVVDRDIDIGDSPYYELSRDQSDLRSGDQVKLAGYGQSSIDGQQRGFEKLQTVDEIQDMQGSIIYTYGNGACSGDSGGTLLDPSGRLAGVMVRADCAGWTLSQRVDEFLDLVDWALEESGICVPDPETCNGVDDDCDGFVDPGCAADGDACLEDRSCAEGLSCLEDAGALVCATPCTPAGAAVCGDGRYCDALGPELGRCREGAPGAQPEGASCAADTDCASLACAAGKCRIECSPNVVACPFGMQCTPDPVLAGVCERPEEAPDDAPLVLGDPCSGDARRCAGGLSCIGTGTDHYCAPGCADGCPVGFHCRESECVRGDLGDAGSSCADDLDCTDGTSCVAAEDAPQLGGVNVCASACEAGGCGDGLACLDGRCIPEQGVVGSACQENTDCGTGLCGHFDEGRRCTERCGGVDACPTGTVCMLLEDGVNLLCREPPVKKDASGCGVVPGRRSGESVGAALLALVALALLRRRP